MLQMLIAREIEANPAVAARMKLAIMPGFNVIVPQGKLVGGTFKKTPLCSRAGRNRLRHQLDQLSREKRPAGRRDLRHFRPAGNDRRLRQSGAARRDRLGAARQLLVCALGLPVPGGPIAWSSEGPPPSPYLRTEGLVSAKCISDGQRGYLWIRTNHKPGRQTHRPDRRRGRSFGHVPARLGHAFVRHARSAGRPDPPGR